MRTHILALILLASPPIAFAQETVSPPLQPAPAVSAPLDERAAWCDAYTARLAEIAEAASPPVAEEFEAQHQQVELNACKLDPQQYERETHVEAERAAEVADR